MPDSRSSFSTVEPLRHVAWARDLDGQRLTYLSATLGDFVGADEESEVGWDALMAAVHPDDAWRFDCSDDTSFEFRYHRRDELRWAAARMVRRGARLDGVVVDITDRVRAEAVTSAEQAEGRVLAHRYGKILDTVFDGINITGFDGVIRYCNRQFAAMLGSTPEEVVGKSMTDLIFPEDATQADERIRRRRAGYPYPFTWRLRSLADGHEVMVRANSRELRDDRGDPEAMLGVITDITATRRIVARLLQSQKLESLGVLAGGVAHDFNNLLVGILGNAGLTLAELPSSSPLKPLVADIQTAALRAAALTRQLLAYSGKGRFVLGPVDLGRIVEELAPSLAAAVGAGVKLTLRLSPGLPILEGDASQIREVVTTLVKNAADAIGDRGGEVTIATSLVHADGAFLADTFVDDELTPGDFVCLEVSDTGEGMTQEVADRIFDPFYTTRFMGRGLGLAAVLGILRGHRGAIKVESEPGQGTTLRTFFPLHRTVTEAHPRPPLEARAPGPRRVLVIDDEESVRTVARRIFERAGYEVLLACDGVEGVERFRERSGEIGAVLLDITMPRMGGEETFAELRRIRGDVRVLLASGYSEQEAMSRFAAKGLAGFVEKPFCAETLLEKLDAILSG